MRLHRPSIYRDAIRLDEDVPEGCQHDKFEGEDPAQMPRQTGDARARTTHIAKGEFHGTPIGQTAEWMRFDKPTRRFSQPK